MSDDENKVTETTPPVPEAAIGIAVKSQVVTDSSWNDEVVEEEVAVVAGSVDLPEPPAPTEEKVPATPTPEEGNEAEHTAEEEEHLLYDIAPGTLKVEPGREIYARLTAEQVQHIRTAMAVLPTTTPDLETFSNTLEDTNEKDLPWILTIDRANRVSYPGEGLFPAAMRNGASWVSQVKNPHSNLPLCDHRHGYKIFDQPNKRINGNEAVEMFLAGTNLGRPVTIPLWHSGFWIKMRAPSAAYLAEIDRALAFSREELGMDLFGAIGSNDRIIFDEVLIDAALKLVTETNIPISKSPLELKEYISQFDIDTVIWGMAQAAFPDGCHIAIPCPSCRGVDHVKANLTRMRFVDESRLTDKQIRTMSKGMDHRQTLEGLKEYADEFEVLNTQKWNWRGREFSFRIPTIDEYLASGREYITSVSRALTETLRDELTDDYRRGQAMKSILNTEEACRFAHFIRDIKIPNTNPKGSSDNFGVVNEVSSILMILRTLSGEFDAVSEFITSVNDYVNDATASIIGFPNVACPSCGKHYLSKSGEETVIVPFNPAIGFFILAQHKISEAGSEPLTNILTLGATALMSRASAPEPQA